MFTWAAALLLAGCGGAGPSSPSVAVKTTTIIREDGSGGTVSLKFPKVLGTSAAIMNPPIQRWVGGLCQPFGEDPPTASSAEDCATQFLSRCRALRAALAPGQSTSCTLDITARVALDAAGVVALSADSYAYTGGAHGMTLTRALNLDIGSGQVLTLGDLLTTPTAPALRRAIESGLRQRYHLTAAAPLRQGGFMVDHPDVPDTVLITASGLEFIYQRYDIAPYVMGAPTALVPYATLAPLIREDGPLPAIRALSPATPVD